MAEQRIRLSMCEFADGTFELYVIDPDTHEEVQITGTRKFTDKERDFFFRLMPPCVWTDYAREAK